MGYGVRSFGRSLEESLHEARRASGQARDARRIHNRVVDLERTPPKNLDGVPETLAYLTERHRLIFSPKANPPSNPPKSSGPACKLLRSHRNSSTKKTPSRTPALVAKHKIVKAHAWMIGIPPAATSIPALRVGLNAVYIPHQHTWHMEHEPVTAGSGKSLSSPASANSAAISELRIYS